MIDVDKIVWSASVISFLSFCLIGLPRYAWYQESMRQYNEMSEYSYNHTCRVDSITTIAFKGKDTADLYILSLLISSETTMIFEPGYFALDRFFYSSDGMPRPTGYEPKAPPSVNITCWTSGKQGDKRLRISPIPFTSDDLAQQYHSAILWLGQVVVVIVFALIILYVAAVKERGDQPAEADPQLHRTTPQPNPTLIWCSDIVIIGRKGWREMLPTHSTVVDTNTEEGREWSTSAAEQFVARSLDALEGSWSALECPLCYSTLAEKKEAVWWPCGHVVCEECAANVLIYDHGADLEREKGYRCPHCLTRAALSSIRKICMSATVRTETTDTVVHQQEEQATTKECDTSIAPPADTNATPHEAENRVEDITTVT